VQVTTTITNEHSVAVNFDNSLVAWWRGESNAVDSIGTNNGTFIASTNYAAGKRGTAFSFDGTSYVSTANSVGITGSMSRSISAWVKISAGVDPGGIAGWGDTFTGVRRIFYLSCSLANCFNFGLWSYYGIDIDSGIPSRDNAWHFLVATYDGTAILYVDGTNKGSVTVAIDSVDTPVFIGKENTALQSHITGLIDDVMIFNRALSSNEVLSLYNAQAYQYTNTFTGLTNGTHTVKAWSQDTAGTTNATELQTFTVAP
jgi:hypothetical protein